MATNPLSFLQDGVAQVAIIVPGLDACDSIARWRLIQRALMANGTTWSAAPNLGSGNALQQYL